MASGIILNISPHRSATQSFTAFCWNHGIRALHWLGPKFDADAEDLDEGSLWERARSLLDLADIFSDLPWPIIWRQAARELPEARFLFIRRDCQWVPAVRKHMQDRQFSHLERAFYAKICGRRTTSLADYSDAELSRGYERHLANAAQLLGTRLSVFALDDPGIDRKLASLLGVELRCPLGRLT